jgi:hypothetical protein
MWYYHNSLGSSQRSLSWFDKTIQSVCCDKQTFWARKWLGKQRTRLAMARTIIIAVFFCFKISIEMLDWKLFIIRCLLDSSMSDYPSQMGEGFWSSRWGIYFLLPAYYFFGLYHLWSLTLRFDFPKITSIFEVCELQWTEVTEATVIVFFLPSVISAFNRRYSLFEPLNSNRSSTVGIRSQSWLHIIAYDEGRNRTGGRMMYSTGGGWVTLSCTRLEGCLRTATHMFYLLLH